MFKVVNSKTGEVLLESDKTISISLEVDGDERVVVTAYSDHISTYLRDIKALFRNGRERAEIAIMRNRWSLHNRMEI